MNHEQAWWAAIALLGHWIREVSHGRSEHNFAVGNIRATNAAWPNGLVHYLQGGDDAQPAPYRAYASVDAGVEDSVRLAVDGSRYRPAMQRLLASESNGPYVVSYGSRSVQFPVDVVQWYADLMNAGWHPYTDAGLDEFRSTVISAAQAVGAPPASSAWGTAMLGAGVVTLGGALWWAFGKR